MFSIIKFFVGLWLIWLPFASALYIFYDDAIGKVKNATISDVYILSKKLNMYMTKSDIEKFENASRFLVSQDAKKYGFDPNISFGEIISKKLNVVYEKQIVVNGKTIDGYDKGIYTVKSTFEYDGMGFDLLFLASDKTFMTPWQAELYGIDRLNITYRGKTKSFTNDSIFPVLYNLAAAGDKKLPWTKFMPIAQIDDAVNKTSSSSGSMSTPNPNTLANPSSGVADNVGVSPPSPVANSKKIVFRSGEYDEIKRKIQPSIANTLIKAKPLKLQGNDGSGIGAIFRSSSDQIYIALNTVNNKTGGTCDINGYAELNGSSVNLRADECKININFAKNNEVNIDQNGCSDYCGVQGYFAGDYLTGDEVVIMDVNAPYKVRLP